MNNSLKTVLRHAPVALVMAASSLLVACASTPVGPTEAARLVQDEGRVGFIENRNSDQRDKVLSRANLRFNADPSCTYQKTGLIDSRRAVLIEDCRYNLVSKQLAYAGAPIEQVSYRFIDGRLLQMRLEFARLGNGSRMNEISHSVAADLQLSEAQPGSDSGTAAHRWMVSKDIVELHSEPETSATALQISDARLAHKVIASR